jgi:hypothetical protein
VSELQKGNPPHILADGRGVPVAWLITDANIRDTSMTGSVSRRFHESRWITDLLFRKFSDLF